MHIMSVTLEVLDRLIGFDTVSAHSNLDMIAFLEAELQARGAWTHRLVNPGGDKSGLIARIGPDVAGGIVLSGHTDVVPVEGQDWTRAPFALTREGSRLYGRGTTDMKGFVACMIAAADLAARATLRAPLTLVFSYDEEIGCVGIQQMRGALPPLLGQPRACIVGEPTRMQIATGHKGKTALSAVCHGQAGHSARAPEFVNALDMAADLVIGLRALQATLRRTGAQDADYDIPFSTVHVGTLSGGRVLNIVPDRAELAFEFRHLAEDPAARIMARITALAHQIEAQYQARWPAARIDLTPITAYPGLDTSPDTAAATLAKDLLGTKQTTKVAFGTEAGVFDDMGIPTVVCGPGSMADQGHKPDEFIDLAQITACEQMLAGVVDRLAT